MTATKYTINRIQSDMRVEGSHWWDPDSMRFFGTKVESAVFQGPGGIYFVTSEQPPHGPRGYTIRQYDPAKLDIDTIGELCGYRSRASAEAYAEELAGEGAEAEAEEFKPVSDLDQFVLDLDNHAGNKKAVTATEAKRLMTHATRHHHLMELACSDEAFCKDFDAEGNHPQIVDCRKRIGQVAKRLGVDVLFSGDPRGCTVKLVMPDGHTDDFAKDGLCVPTNK